MAVALLHAQCLGHRVAVLRDQSLLRGRRADGSIRIVRDAVSWGDEPQRRQEL